MEQNPFGLGALQSPPDYRSDIALANATIPIPLPSNYQTDISMLGVLNQKQTPACVSHAWAQVMKYWWYVKTGEIVEFSPRFLDILSAEADIPIDGGRRPRTVAAISKNIGCCTIKLLPNNTDLSIEQYRDKNIITQEMRDEAVKYKIPGYIEPPTDTYSLRNFIYQYGVVSLLLNIGKEWWTPSWNKKDILPLKPPAVVVSGHQTVRHGWDNDLAIGLNEWSYNWADEGKYTYNENQYQPYTREAITIAELSQEVINHLKKLPAPGQFKYTFNQNLQYGDGRTEPSEEVKKLQIALSTLGYFKYPDITGFYGSITRKAVFDFQQDHFQLGFMALFVYRGKYFFDETRVALNSIINN